LIFYRIVKIFDSKNLKKPVFSKTDKIMDIYINVYGSNRNIFFETDQYTYKHTLGILKMMKFSLWDHF
jgi:hypothetical protein